MNLDSNDIELVKGNPVHYIGNWYANEMIPGDIYTVVGFFKPYWSDTLYITIESCTTGMSYTTLPISCARITDDPTKFIESLTI